MPKLLRVILLSLMVPACAAAPPGPAESGAREPTHPPIHAPLADAAAAMQGGDLAAASRAYERAARSATTADAGEYWLRAAELAVQHGEADRALLLAAETPTELLSTPEMQARRQIVRAESFLIKGEPYEAARALPASTQQVPRLAVRIEELRAEALFAAPPPPVNGTPLPAATALNAGGIALLLPLSGRFAETAEAVRDGVFAAHFRAGAEGRIRVYDVGAEHEAVQQAYEQALADGAAVIVGPLRKESVAQLAQQGAPRVPVLALNYLEEGQSTPAGFFQFGLAPEDEARSAAAHATRQGLRRALALVPQTDWGQRGLNAFLQQLKAGDGELIEVVRYTPGQSDFSAIVRKLLRASDARRRRDADLLFLVARPLDGRLIMPMLNFYYAADLPAYSTALVYDGNPHRDLSGLRFCDTPWTLENTRFASERDAAASLRTQQQYPRLFAFGLDAHALALQLLRTPQSLAPLSGATGVLTVTPSGAIRRDLQCAQVRPGALQPLDGPAAP